jgi:hypothetical protein
MPSGAHNTGGMAITGMATIGIGVGAADGSAGGIAAAAFVAGADGKGATAQISPAARRPKSKEFGPPDLHPSAAFPAG